MRAFFGLSDGDAGVPTRYWLILAAVVTFSAAVYQTAMVRFLSYVFPFHMLFAISLVSTLAIFFTGLGAFLSRRWRGRHRFLTLLLFLSMPLTAVAVNLSGGAATLAAGPLSAALLLTAPPLFLSGALTGISYHETMAGDPSRLRHLVALSALAFFAGYLLSAYLFTVFGVWDLLLAAALLLLLPPLWGRPAWLAVALAAALLVPAAGPGEALFAAFARAPHLWEEGEGRHLLGTWSPYARLDFYEMSDGRLAGAYNRTQQWAVGDPSGDIAVRRALYGELSGDVLVIGSGGGYGLLSLTKASSVTAVEIDPGVVTAMKGPLSAYNRNIYNAVEVYAGDGRAFLDGTDRRFDVIVFEAADLSCSAIPHSFINMENYLYTVEGIRSALAHLRPDGLFLILVTKELIPAPKFINALPPSLHWRLYDGEIEVMRTVRMNFDFIVASPSAEKIARWSERLRDGDLRLRPVDAGDLSRKSSFGLDPITDNRPLLYFGGWWQAVPFLILLLLFLAVAGAVVATAPRRADALFFSALGVAFMLAELTVINGMRAYLGGYLETSSLLLGTLALGAAAGAWFHDRPGERTRAAGTMLSLALMLVMLHLAPLSWPFALKALWLVAALAPAAFFMGTLFPVALLRAEGGYAARHYATDTVGSALGLVLFYLLVLAGGFALAAAATLLFYAAALALLRAVR